EVKEAARPIAAAEMVLVRIAYAADLPSPEDVIRSLADAPQRPAAQGRGNGAPAAPAAPGPTSYGEPARASGRQALAPSVMPPPARDPVSHSVETPAAAQTPASSVTCSSRPRSNATCVWYGSRM